MPIGPGRNVSVNGRCDPLENAFQTRVETVQVQCDAVEVEVIISAYDHLPCFTDSLRKRGQFRQFEEYGQPARPRPCSQLKSFPFKDRAEIRDEARLLLERWSTPRGGFVRSDYGDGEAIGAPLWKKEAMLEAFREFDPFVGARRSSQSHG